MMTSTHVGDGDAGAGVVGAGAGVVGAELGGAVVGAGEPVEPPPPLPDGPAGALVGLGALVGPGAAGLGTAVLGAASVGAAGVGSVGVASVGVETDGVDGLGVEDADVSVSPTAPSLVNATNSASATAATTRIVISGVTRVDSTRSMGQRYGAHRWHVSETG